MSNRYLSGDDPNARMAQAKAALKEVIKANQANVRFKFGRYTQPVNGTTLADSSGNATSLLFPDTGDDPAPYLYMTTDPAAATQDDGTTTGSQNDRWFQKSMPVWDASGKPVYDTSVPPKQLQATHYYVQTLNFYNGETVSFSGNTETVTVHRRDQDEPPQAEGANRHGHRRVQVRRCSLAQTAAPARVRVSRG